MSNSDKNDVTTEPSPIEKANIEQLEMLKGVADSLGIKYSSRIGLQALSEKIKEYTPQQAPVQQVHVVHAPPEPSVDKKEAERVAANKFRDKMVKNATRLIRVIVTCMDPAKVKHKGEVFTVSNSIVPTMKKYIPFNNAEGWHVPKMIVDTLKEYKCQVFQEVRDSKGRETVKSILIPAYTVTELPPLTETEVKELAEKQALARSID